jgi:DNA-binding transcriptional regulator LsrR (DeoR family)
MLSLRSKYKLKDLSQGSRIAFIRYYRGMTQHEVADLLGVQHDNKRRIMTRYEKGNKYKANTSISDELPFITIGNKLTIKYYDEANITDIVSIVIG